MRVELVGGMGIGKTTLCRSLEIIGFNCIYTGMGGNPFMDGGAVRDRESTFPALMWDALGKYNEIQARQQADLINIVDQGLLNLRAAGRMLFGNEDREGQAILMKALDYLEEQAGPPDLIVHLKSSPAELMRRIRGRGRPEEEGLSIGYIAELQHQIGHLVTRARLDGQPVLTVDMEEAGQPGDMVYAEALARQIAETVFTPQAQKPARARRLPANDKTPLLQYVEITEAM
jgi:deoxyadenosine/deoxycytidine kinase